MHIRHWQERSNLETFRLLVVASHVYEAGASYLPACRVPPVGTPLADDHHRESHMSIIASRTCPSLRGTKQSHSQFSILNSVRSIRRFQP
ncbi:MAG: hypothetical protein LBS80_04260, partial [Tannerella sp.]|nr:hypothetical protein [Tannerella sp.]